MLRLFLTASSSYSNRQCRTPFRNPRVSQHRIAARGQEVTSSANIYKQRSASLSSDERTSCKKMSTNTGALVLFLGVLSWLWPSRYKFQRKRKHSSPSLSSVQPVLGQRTDSKKERARRDSCPESKANGAKMRERYRDNVKKFQGPWMREDFTTQDIATIWSFRYFGR